MSKMRARIERAAMTREHALLVDRAIADGAGDERAFVASTGADPLRLRGIPAIGRSVAGCIRGTDPERAALR